MKKTILYLVLAIFIVQSASAYTFLNIYLNEKGEAAFIGETTGNFTLPKGIEIKDGKIFGKTSDLTNKRAEIWSISYYIKDADINLILPEGAVIKLISGGDISLSNGRIAVFFSERIEISYLVEEAPSGIGSGKIITIIILAAILLVLVIYLINYSKKENLKKEKNSAPNTESKTKKVRAPKKDKIEIIKNILNEREKIILEKLKESGKIKSSYLRRLTEIPKASFSRHIQELEKKKLIRRSGDGRNKFVEFN